MKRLAAVLAAAVLGTGCIWVDDTCRERDVDLSWALGFDGPDPVAGRTCAAAGVTYVDVFLDDRQVAGPLVNGHFRCSELGVLITGVTADTSRLTVEGLAADGTILYREERSIGSRACGTQLVDVAPAAGYVDLQYQFVSGGIPVNPQACVGDWLWLAIYDEVAQAETVLSDRDFAPQAFACGGAFRLELPMGSHVLRWMEERGPATAYVLEAADCTDRPFGVGAAVATPVPVDLDVNAAAACAR